MLVTKKVSSVNLYLSKIISLCSEGNVYSYKGTESCLPIMSGTSLPMPFIKASIGGWGITVPETYVVRIFHMCESVPSAKVCT